MRQSFFSVLFLLPVLLLSFPLQGQDVSEVAGDWTGAIEIDGRELAINLTFSYSDDMLDGTIDIPEQEAYTLPVEVLDSAGDTLVFQFQTGRGAAVFYGNRDMETKIIEGQFSQSGRLFPFYLNKSAFANGLTETELTIPTSAGKIGGSLVLQESVSPLVILVSGSGSQDRDQNVAGFQTFRELSTKLYDAGYSTFRYDDRGTGQSEGDPDATLLELAADLVEITEYMRSQYRNNISGVILLGHSEGGLVASLAANEINVEGLVLMATPFLRGDKIIKEQIKKICDVREISDRITNQNLEFQERVFEVVRTGSGWEQLENELAERLEQQISKLPVEQRNALGDMSSFIDSQVDRQLQTAKSRWFRSLINLEPSEVIADVEAPVFAFFGEKDTQVLPENNRAVAAELASRDSVALQYVVVQDANHLFQRANSGMPSEYGMLEHQFTDGFMEEIVTFLDRLQFRSPD